MSLCVELCFGQKSIFFFYCQYFNQIRPKSVSINFYGVPIVCLSFNSKEAALNAGCKKPAEVVPVFYFCFALYNSPHPHPHHQRHPHASFNFGDAVQCCGGEEHHAALQQRDGRVHRGRFDLKVGPAEGGGIAEQQRGADATVLGRCGQPQVNVPVVFAAHASVVDQKLQLLDPVVLQYVLRRRQRGKAPCPCVLLQHQSIHALVQPSKRLGLGQACRHGLACAVTPYRSAAARVANLAPAKDDVLGCLCNHLLAFRFGEHVQVAQHNRPFPRLLRGGAEGPSWEHPQQQKQPQPRHLGTVRKKTGCCCCRCCVCWVLGPDLAWKLGRMFCTC
eukprot:m.239751 g.239751  ORF g.239751 m.239751 type:complete len:333 (+) comp22520_c3_seq28:3357-4355(+)